MNSVYLSARQTYKFFSMDYSYSRILFNPILFNNKISPCGGNSIDQNKDLSMIKSFSEAAERRVVMNPTVNYNKKYAAFDLITKSTKIVLGYIIGYNQEKDSTGTATHIDAYQAIIHSVGELIEKNALLRMWYRYDVINVSDLGWHPLNDTKTIFLVNNYFIPYYVVLSAKKDKLNYWHCGLGFSIDSLNKAKKAAFEEMQLIWFQNNIDKLNPNSPTQFNNDMSVYWNWTDKQKQHMNTIVNMKNKNAFLFNNTNELKNIEELGKKLSDSFRHIYIVYLKDFLFKEPLVTIRSFSNELISCVPKKEVLMKLINEQDINFIDIQDITDSVDCPIV